MLVEQPRRVFIPPAPRRPQRRLFDASMAMRGFWAEFEAPVNSFPGWSQLHFLAEDIRLDWDAVKRVKPGMSEFNKAWAFPMFDGNANCVGIRLREFCGSKKWSIAGSQDGLFYDPELEPREAVYNGIKGREIVVVEGATDTIAGYALGI